MGMHKLGLELETTQLVGVTDANKAAGQARAEEYNIPFYDDYQTMIADAKPDIVVIIVPHPFHAPMTIHALNAGCHVLVEKPLAVHVAEADEMIAAAQKAGKLLAVNFQQRLRPEIMAAKQLVDSGQLGKIQHADIKITWTRTAKYYTVVDWRGTWKGEGGGVLMNQAPHELDLLCHLLGMPARVAAWTRTIAHTIETEDTVQAMLEWEDGALGSVHISTAEAGQPQRFEIIGTGGYLQISDGKLNFQRFDTELRDFIKTHDDPFSAPNLIPQKITLPESAGDHKAVYRNLHSAILEGTPLIADAVSARCGLELSNAMTYSSRTRTEVEFPLNRDKYVALLEDLRAGVVR